MKDTSKEKENEDHPNHEVEKPQLEDEEIWTLSQLHASFQNAEYMKTLRREMYENRSSQQWKWI